MIRQGLIARLQIRLTDRFDVDVHLEAHPGRTVALLGPNGAGKTTILSAIAGLTPIDRGAISLGGRLLDDPIEKIFISPPDRRVGVVFQDYSLFPHLTVEENVAFGPRSRGVGSAAARRSAGHWIDRLGLEELRRAMPDELSGGQAQRVALARALITDPDLLLLDEPLSAVDATSRVELRRLLLDHLAGFDGPRLVVTHDPAEAFLLADEVYIVEDGRVTQSGTPDAIRLRPASAFAADLAGINLLSGNVLGDVVDVNGHDLHIADDLAAGPVLLTIHPHAVSVHRERPAGSPRNTWRTTVDEVERSGSRHRLHVGAPLPLTVEVTTAARDELGLQPGSVIWLAVKATEIGVQGGSAISAAESPFA